MTPEQLQREGKCLQCGKKLIFPKDIEHKYSAMCDECMEHIESQAPPQGLIVEDNEDFEHDPEIIEEPEYVDPSAGDPLLLLPERAAWNSMSQQQREGVARLIAKLSNPEMRSDEVIRLIELDFANSLGDAAPEGSTPPVPDMVNHPPHYTFGGIEVIDALEAWQLPFHLANAVKYIARSGHKGNEIEDIRKAIWYLDRYIKFKEKEK